MTSLLLIRHGHVDTDSRLCGCDDVPLSEGGRSHLDALVKRCAGRPAPDALYTSPLIRARDVATALGRAWLLHPHVVDDAREIDCGLVEGVWTSFSGAKSQADGCRQSSRAPRLALR